VLAVSSVKHEELLSIVEPLLSDLPSVPRPKEPKSYTSGDYRCQSEAGVCIRKKTVFSLYFCLYLYFSVRAQASVKSNIPLIARGPILLLHLNFLVAGITRRMLWF